jgi:hypothetical protein
VRPGLEVTAVFLRGAGTAACDPLLWPTIKLLGSVGAQNESVFRG